ncbi:MAG TPA: hypothetical protein VGF23_04355 [Gaiellaceae bacterium]|jgi:hypothetical protein
MTVLGDIAGALNSYLDDEVTVSIVDVDPPGNQVDINDVVLFQVRIENGGHINMSGVTLHVHGLNGVDVSTSSAGPWSDTAILSGLSIAGGSSKDTNNLYFKAPPSQRAAGTQLVSSHIYAWFGDWNHMFDNHTNGSETPSGVYTDQVHDN